MWRMCKNARNLRCASAIALCAMLAACAVGPDYHAPKLKLPEQWSAMKGAPADKVQPDLGLPSRSKRDQPAFIPYGTTARQPSQRSACEGWWHRFNDEKLNVLITEAEENNHDLKIAATRVRMARAQRVGAAAALYPQITAGSTANRGSRENFFTGKAFGMYDANFDAAWEIDLFGGNQRKAEAAEAVTQEAEASARGALISLRAEVARNYFAMRNLQEQLRITQETASAQAETLNLTREMQTAGTVSGLDAAQAEAQFQSTLSRVPELQARLAAVKNQLAVLLGKTPESLDSSLNAPEAMPVADSAVVVAMPAEVIAQRPDLAAAERELASKTALNGAAIAEMYPKLSLSALLGAMHSSFFVGGTTREWETGGGLTAPIFNAGRIQANIRSSDAEAQAALYAYQQTALKALAEVETALTNYLKEDEKRTALKTAAEAAKHAEALARERYQKGADSFLSVLTAQRAAFDAQSALATSEAAVAEDLVAVYKALGV